ncbi:preprotein translocase subunit YajC [Corynebacterium vitaeruminis]|uniref:preprotein translocase subunit YajC n=1 Tax=Corynebacterium vitaeruminis TaxID=38305 RepID=UPI0023F89CB7|nr:preprotein translocase subunit YajC [Corynebacterium vitaeruminis]
MENIIILLVLLAIMILPSLMMQKKQKQRLEQIRQLQSQLALGDRVVTTAGIFATVAGVGTETVDLEVAEGVVLTFEKSAVIRRELDAGASNSLIESNSENGSNSLVESNSENGSNSLIESNSEVESNSENESHPNIVSVESGEATSAPAPRVEAEAEGVDKRDAKEA